MNKLIFFVVASVFVWFAPAARADDRMVLTPAEQKAAIDAYLASVPPAIVVAPRYPKFSLSSTLLSEYVSPHGYLLSEKTTVQTELRASWASGFFASAKWSVGLNDSALSSDGADEIDTSVGWAKKIGSLSCAAGISHFNFVELDKLDKDLAIAYGEVGYSIRLGEGHTLTPFVRMEERWRLPDFDWARSMPVVGVKDSWSIAPGFTLNQRLGFLYDSGVPVSDSGWLLQYQIGLNCKISESVSVEPFLRLSDPLTIDDKRENQTIFGFTLTVSL